MGEYAYQEQAKIAACAQMQGAGPIAARDKSETERALDDLRNVVERYDCLVGRLSDKLNPITMPATPQMENDQSVEKAYQTGLASQINQLRCQLRNVTDNLESLYERIQL